MPIEYSMPIELVPQEEFHALDKEVMKHAFSIHNEMGRFFDEAVYQTELARRCEQVGISVENEVMVSVTHKTFRKDYYLDLLFLSGSIYELKCVSGLSGQHDGQLINYPLLTGTHHGKLMNFRPFSVESRFVSTGLTPQKRRDFKTDSSAWKSGCEQSEKAKNLVFSLLNDWGAFLSIELYRDAVVHFLGGKDRVFKPVNILCDRQVVGQKPVCLLNDRTAFHLSAMSERLASYEIHLHRLLAHMDLDAVQWVNLDQNHIHFKTIQSCSE